MSEKTPDYANYFYSIEIFQEELNRQFRCLANERLLWIKTKLSELLDLHAERPSYWTKEKFKKTMDYIVDNQMPVKLQETPVQLNDLNNYNVTSQNRVKKTNGNYNSKNVPTITLVQNQHIYDLLKQSHLHTKHGNFNKMVTYIKDKNYLIPMAAIVAFSKMCKYCQNKNLEKRVAVKPQELRPKPAVYNLIDLHLKPAGNYKYLFHYCDLNTKSSILVPLITNSAEEIASGLLRGFTEFGRPTYLHSDESDLFMPVHKELIKLRPSVESIQLQQCHQSAMDKMCENIMKLIQNWLVENECSSWAFGVYSLRYKVNCVFDETMIKFSPQALSKEQPLLIKTEESSNSGDESKTESLDKRNEFKTEDKTNINEKGTLTNALGI